MQVIRNSEREFVIILTTTELNQVISIWETADISMEQALANAIETGLFEEVKNANG